MFTCLPLPGEMIQFDENIFQMGWFNHQPVNHWNLLQVYQLEACERFGGFWLDTKLMVTEDWNPSVVPKIPITWDLRLIPWPLKAMSEIDILLPKVIFWKIFQRLFESTNLPNENKTQNAVYPNRDSWVCCGAKSEPHWCWEFGRGFLWCSELGILIIQQLGVGPPFGATNILRAANKDTVSQCFQFVPFTSSKTRARNIFNSFFLFVNGFVG